MKFRLLFCAACLFFVPLRGFTQAGRHSVGLDVKLAASGGAAAAKSGVHNSGDTSTLTKTQSIASEPVYNVEVRNFSQSADSLTLEWYVFAKSASSAHAQARVHDSGKESISIGGGKSASLTVKPKPITHETQDSLKTTTRNDSSKGTTSTSHGSRSVKGDKPAGWMMRLIAGGELVAVKASEPSLEELGRHAEKLGALK